MDELRDDLLPKPRDVHRLTGGEVLDVAGQLRGASGIKAVPRHFTGSPFNFRSAGWAVGGRNVNLLAAVAFFFERGNDVGDDLASPFQQNLVPDPQVFFLDKVEIVQCGLAHDHTADADGFKLRERREHACAPDINLNIAERRFNFNTGIFVGEGTSGILANIPKRLG